MIIVGDCETNGLLDKLDRIWCASFEDVETGAVFNYTPSSINTLPDLLECADLIVMHNGIGFDREAFKKALNYTIPIEKMWDTLIWSKLLNPDRKSPKGWKGQPKPHSIEAWGMRFHHKKPEHEDWGRFSRDMMYRCEQDRIIGRKVYLKLLEEMKK